MRLNESPLKIPLGDSFEEPEIGSEKIQNGRVSVLNIHDVKRQGNDDKAKECWIWTPSKPIHGTCSG